MAGLLTFLYSLAILAGSWTVYCNWCLLQNYRKARQLGFYIIVQPISPLNPVWQILSNYFDSWVRKLPPVLFHYFKFGMIDWACHEKYLIHEKHGDVISIVSPAWIQLYVADAGAVESISARRKDFPQPEVIYSMC